MLGNQKCFFLAGDHRLTVVQTDLLEPEELIRRLSANAKQDAPELFEGKAPCVYFKLRYILPCEPFHELRRLILRVQETTGLRAYYKGIVAIEATEWLGHEREEYFSVMLKYLYDHRETWYAAMVLKDCSPLQLQRFTSACAVYITPRIDDENIFTEQDRLCEAIRRCFAERGRTLRLEALHLLTRMMMRDELADARSFALLERMTDEVITSTGDRKEISETQVRKYLQEPSTALAMLAGKTLIMQRSRSDEESIQL